MTGNVSRIPVGNMKGYISQDCLILKLYPYHILVDDPKAPEFKPSDETKAALNKLDSILKPVPRNVLHVTSKYKTELNAINRLYNLMGIGYCNDWDYFLTVTIDGDKVNRYSADAVCDAVSHEFKKIRDRVKTFQYCYILEQHKDGAFHCHGFVSGLTDKMITTKPVYVKKNGKRAIPSKSKFIQLGITQDFFNLGLIVISPILSKQNVIEYVSKYITKNLAIRKKNGKCVFHSHGLKTFKNQYFEYSESPTFGTGTVVDKNGWVVSSDIFDKRKVGNIIEFRLNFDIM